MPAKKKSTVNKAGNYTKPAMRKRLFNKIKAGSKGGKPGQWSASKAQMVAKQYKAKGGGLKKWTDEKWGTKSGKNSTQGKKATGERYLPKAARDSLSKKEYAATSKKKRADTKKGKQHSAQPKKIAKKTARHRK